MEENYQKDLIKFLTKHARELYHELLALRVTGYIAEQNGFPFQSTLKNARQSPDVKTRTDHYFASFEEALANIDAEDQEKALQAFLEKWKPEGEPN